MHCHEILNWGSDSHVYDLFKIKRPTSPNAHIVRFVIIHEYFS